MSSLTRGTDTSDPIDTSSGGGSVGRPERAVPAVLSQVLDVLQPALRAALADLCPDMSRVSGYHLGWWDADGKPDSAGGGKALRPALALLATRAVGAPDASAAPACVAVELVHNFSLLHDDIMDGDAERRHRPTAWTVFGTSAAILAGDALVVAAVDALLAVGTPAAARATRALAAATQRLITGQTADLDFEDRLDVTIDECVRMAGNKTAALLGNACALGALVADADQATCDALAAFGEELDDLLGIWGAPDRTGKPVRADLRARKKSLPVVAALRTPGDAATELAELYKRPEPLTEEQLLRAADLIERTGGRAWAEDEADRRYAAAIAHLDTVAMPDAVRAEFVELARFVVERDR
jgi:geranylgeranyl diphosphate synthase type I